MHGCRIAWNGLVVVGLLLSAGSLSGQETAPSTPPQTPPPPPSGDGFSGRDSTVGYIDSALTTDMLRLRFEAGYGINRATRAEFFYARTGPLGPGLPLPERNIDYQDLMFYAEKTLMPGLSGFVEVPLRWLNPEVNANAFGLADMNFGGKYALVDDEDFVTSLQLRVFVPTGDARRGLGNDHVSLEPALLVWRRLTECWGLEAELRYWTPLGGTDFAGDVVRYGVGVHYDLWRAEKAHVTPVAELVGWTVLNGKEAVPNAGGFVQNAAGDTIVNAKLGVRVGLGDRSEFYAGYGKALTGARWYDDVVRLEWRWNY